MQRGYHIHWNGAKNIQKEWREKITHFMAKLIQNELGKK